MKERVRFYELPLASFDALSEDALGTWRSVGRNRSRFESLVETLKQPIPQYEGEHFFVAAALGVVGDTPLPSGEEMLGDGSARYSDLVAALNERRGGMWELVEPSPERAAALDPESFDVARLQDHYMGKAYYYPHEEEDGGEDGDGPGLLEALLDKTLAHVTDDDFPADAGEQMRGKIALLRCAVQAIERDSVLLIRHLDP